jgi:hypothetical protein
MKTFFFLNKGMASGTEVVGGKVVYKVIFRFLDKCMFFIILVPSFSVTDCKKKCTNNDGSVSNRIHEFHTLIHIIGL